MLLAIIRFVQTWKRYNASLSELSRLGDRELADIGITRGAAFEEDQTTPEEFAAIEEEYK